MPGNAIVYCMRQQVCQPPPSDIALTWQALK